MSAVMRKTARATLNRPGMVNERHNRQVCLSSVVIVQIHLPTPSSPVVRAALSGCAVEALVPADAAMFVSGSVVTFISFSAASPCPVPRQVAARNSAGKNRSRVRPRRNFARTRPSPARPKNEPANAIMELCLAS